MLARTDIKAEKGRSLGRVINGALVGSHVDPVTALHFRAHAVSCRQISVGIEFQQGMTAPGLPDISISRIVEHNRFGLAVIAGSEIPRHVTLPIEFSYRIRREIGHVQ